MGEKNKILIFIPYQDEDNFYYDGILTREFAMLYLLHEAGYKKVISVKKPRTILDSKRYQVNLKNYPFGTVESKVKSIVDEATTIQYKKIISFEQIFKRRIWWKNGYEKTINIINSLLDFEKNEYLVYSDNPFAQPLISYLKNKGSKIYFDVMDNFAIHPSLNCNERKVALDSYISIFKHADIISANSNQTCDYMQKHTSKIVYLVKNGVFPNNQIQENISLNCLERIKNEKKKYKKCIGYIGKLGKRLDAELIEKVSLNLRDYLFVFVGDSLKGQLNDKLLKLFEEDNNILHIDGIPSAYVYSVLDEFDILSIPHSVGKNENGGDPLKLYQYLTRQKPIITTPILGVDEFKDFITISNDVKEWMNFIVETQQISNKPLIETFTWETRVKPIFEELVKK